MPKITGFDEVRALAASLPKCHAEARDQARSALFSALGPGYENQADIVGWLAGAQRREQPSVDHPRVALFLAIHGVAADLAEASPELVAADLAALTAGGGQLHRSIEARDADLRVYELALSVSTADSRLVAAMAEAEAARAVAYGMMAVEPGLDVIILASRGLGGEIAGWAIRMALAPGDAAPPARYRDRAAAAAARHAMLEDPMALLAALGGPDIAAMVGAILAGRLAGTAIILDGEAAAAAGAIVSRLRGDGLEHCLNVGVDRAPPNAGLGALDRLKEACALLADLQ